jgi:hypothetical protein
MNQQTRAQQKLHRERIVAVTVKSDAEQSSRKASWLSRYPGGSVTVTTSSRWPPCLVCGRRPADAHHLRFAQAPALGRKVSDEFTVPALSRTPS